MHLYNNGNDAKTVYGRLPMTPCEKPTVSSPQRRNTQCRIIDSQSVKPTEAGGPKGYDAGKKCSVNPQIDKATTSPLLLRADLFPNVWVSE